MSWTREESELLEGELERLVERLEPALPTPEDFGLSDHRTTALNELRELAAVLGPNDEAERAELLYLEARFLADSGAIEKAARARLRYESAATVAWFRSRKSSPWLGLQWARIRRIGRNQRWLAFERALTELIHALSSTTRDEMRPETTRARHLRGLCQQLRGLGCAEAEVGEALLASGLRELQTASDGQSLLRECEQAAARLERWRRDGPGPPAQTPSAPVPAMGAVRFAELPPAVRELFAGGANRISAGLFLAERDPYGVLWMLALFLFFAAAIAAGGVVLFGWISILGAVSLVPMAIMLTATAMFARKLLELSRQRKKGASIYGLVLDERKLAVRTVAAFSDLSYFFGPDAVLLPLERVEQFRLASNPTYAMSGRMRHADVLRVVYRDDHDIVRSVSIPDLFEETARTLLARLRVWNKDIAGEWNDPSDETITVRFDQGIGVISGFGDGHSPFRWRDVDSVAVAIEPDPESSSALEHGVYHYEIEYEAGAYELRFLDGLAGCSIRRLRQGRDSHEEGVGPIHPRRIAGRIAAAEPTGEPW